MDNRKLLPVKQKSKGTVFGFQEKLLSLQKVR